MRIVYCAAVVRTALLVFFTLYVVSAAEARAWRDLDEGEHEIYGREREEKLPIRMFFIQQEKWEDHNAFHAFWLYAYTDYPRYKSSRFLPFYYSLSSKTDNRHLFLSPVYYREIDGKEHDQSLLWLYYWGGEEGSVQGYSVFFPLYYSRVKSADERLLVSPFFLYARGRENQKSSENDVTLGIPLLPVILWKSGEQKRDLTLFYFFRHRSDKEATLSYTLPLYYYDAAKNGSSGFFFSPLYLNDFTPRSHDTAVLWLYYRGGNAETGKNYHGLLPFYFSSERSDKERFLITPLFAYSKTHQPATADAKESHADFFLSPLYASETIDGDSHSALLWLYYSGNNAGTGKNYSGLFPLYYESRRGETDRFFISPLFWYSRETTEAKDPAVPAEQKSLFISPVYMQSGSAADRDSALLWLYYWGRGAQGGSYRVLFPLYYDAQKGEDERFLLTPLFWYSRKTDPATKQQSSSWGVPAVPVVYWSSSANESEFNLLYLIRHKRETNNLLSYALPFYYYSREGNESLASYLVPFVWVSSKADSSTWLILPFFYSAEAKNSAVKISPLYFALSDEHSNFGLFIPLYLNYRTKDYSFHINLTGISLSEEKLTYLPVSAEISREKILVDWDLGWFYNLFRVSSRDTLRLQEGANPAVVAPPVEPRVDKPPAAKRAGKRGKLSPAEKTAVSTIYPPLAKDSTQNSARIIQKRERTRADADNFFGLYFLFGVSAYERADHYRHFRFLPLSWLTWNANNDQGVQTVIPFYVKYQDEDSRYLVFFPFYGIQQKFFYALPVKGAVAGSAAAPACTGEISTWLLIAYWNEFDCDTQTAEQTVLWPIYNRYQSAEQGGFRVFPVFWSKWQRKNGHETAMHFSPLHFTRIDGENFSTTSWLFYRRRTAADNSWGIWGLVHLDRRHDGREATTYILPLYHHRVEYAAVKNAQQVEVSPPRAETLFTFAALFWRYHDVYGDEAFTGHYSPLYVYLDEKSRYSFFLSWIFYRSESATGTSYGIPVLFHRRLNKDDRYANLFIMPFYHSRDQRGEGTAEYTTWLAPLFYHRTSADSGTFLMPFFYRYSQRLYVQVRSDAQKEPAPPDAEDFEVGHISPFYLYNASGKSSSLYSWIFYRSASETETSFGVPLLMHCRLRRDGSYGNFYIPLFYRSSETLPDASEEKVTWLLPLFYTRNSDSASVFVVPLFYRWSSTYTPPFVEKSETAQSYHFVKHVSPFYIYTAWNGYSDFYSWLFYRFSSEHQTTFGVPLLIHRKTLSDGSYSNFFLLPFYWSREKFSAEAGGAETVTLLFPLWYQRSNERTTVRLIAGYYHESAPQYRKDLFPLVAGRTSDESAGTYSWHVLLHTFWYERKKQAAEFRLLYGLGFNYADEERLFSWHFALFTGYKHYLDTGRVRHHLLPFWWSSRQGDESDLYLPFLLAAFQNHDQGNRIFRVIALGLLYYQNTDYNSYEQTLGVALGALYYHNKYPERRFDSYGSLYGLLWHYETEDNYKRFSLLTFIYTRTETEKGTRHRLLGIPLN